MDKLFKLPYRQWHALGANGGTTTDTSTLYEAMVEIFKLTTLTLSMSKRINYLQTDENLICILNMTIYDG